MIPGCHTGELQHRGVPQSVELVDVEAGGAQEEAQASERLDGRPESRVRSQRSPRKRFLMNSKHQCVRLVPSLYWILQIVCSMSGFW